MPFPRINRELANAVLSAGVPFPWLYFLTRLLLLAY